MDLKEELGKWKIDEYAELIDTGRNKEYSAGNLTESLLLHHNIRVGDLAIVEEIDFECGLLKVRFIKNGETDGLYPFRFKKISKEKAESIMLVMNI
jgi:hypothetical protein